MAKTASDRLSPARARLLEGGLHPRAAELVKAVDLLEDEERRAGLLPPRVQARMANLVAARDAYLAQWLDDTERT